MQKILAMAKIAQKMMETTAEIALSVESAVVALESAAAQEKKPATGKLAAMEKSAEKLTAMEKLAAAELAPEKLVALDRLQEYGNF